MSLDVEQFLITDLFVYDDSVQPPSAGTFEGESVFAGLVETALLTFYVKDGTIEVDEMTGVEVESDRAVTIQAYLTQEKNSEDIDLPGVNASSVWLEGYCVEPMIMPEGIGAGAIADYSFKPAYGPTVTGKFLLHRTPASNFDVVQEEVGDELEGYLNINGSA